MRGIVHFIPMSLRAEVYVCASVHWFGHTLSSWDKTTCSHGDTVGRLMSALFSMNTHTHRVRIKKRKRQTQIDRLSQPDMMPYHSSEKALTKTQALTMCSHTHTH